MVFDLNSTTCNLPQSSTSSCTDFCLESTSCNYTNQCNRSIRCGNTHCHRCCNFINDHTYAVLKKICRKIIKDFQRQQCREKYTIFDGGNSVNVRIHRASSVNCDKSQTSSKVKLAMADSSLATARNRKHVRGFSSTTEATEKGRVGGRNSNRLLEKEHAKSRGRQAANEVGDNDAADGKGRPAKGKKRREADVDDDSGDERSKGAKGRNTKQNKQQALGDGDVGDGRGGKSKSKRSLEPEDEVDAKGRKNKGKRSLDADDEVDGKGRKNKGKRNVDDDEETERKGKNKGRRAMDAEEDYDDGRGKKSKGKQGFGPDDGGESKGRKSKNRKQFADDDASVDIDERKKRKGKRSTKYDVDDMPIISDLRRKVRRGEEVGPAKPGRGDSIDKSGRSRGNAFDEDFTKTKKSKRKSNKDLPVEAMGGSKSLGGRSGKSLPNVRGSQKYSKEAQMRNGRGPKNLASVLNLQGRRYNRASAATPDPSTNKFVKLSRCDEARPCDYLRANMEQREVYKLCEAGQFTTRTCSTWPCSDVYSCCQPDVPCVC